MIPNRLTITGFLVLDHYDLLQDFIAEVGPWVASGELKYRETIVEGIENMPAGLHRPAGRATTSARCW